MVTTGLFSVTVGRSGFGFVAACPPRLLSAGVGRGVVAMFASSSPQWVARRPNERPAIMWTASAVKLFSLDYFPVRLECLIASTVIQGSGDLLFVLVSQWLSTPVDTCLSLVCYCQPCLPDLLPDTVGFVVDENGLRPAAAVVHPVCGCTTSTWWPRSVHARTSESTFVMSSPSFVMYIAGLCMCIGYHQVHGVVLPCAQDIITG